jgi:hypothetical protein
MEMYVGLQDISEKKDPILKISVFQFSRSRVDFKSIQKLTGESSDTKFFVDFSQKFFVSLR